MAQPQTAAVPPQPHRPPPPQPAVMQPTEPPPAYTPSAAQVATADLQKRQDELERKAAELQRKEQEMNRANAYQSEYLRHFTYFCSRKKDKSTIFLKVAKNIEKLLTLP